jgi:hypothetical protein
MKSFFLPLLTAAVLFSAASGAQAQDKPVLNTTPPGTRPQPAPQPQQPQPTPAPQPTPQAEPAPAPTPAPEAPAPANQPQPTPDNPSGLNFPGRTKSTSGFGGPALTAKKMFIYTNFGLGFNSSYGISQFNISVAPALGYRFSERFSAGPGISYAYNNISYDKSVYRPVTANGGYNISTNSIGLKIFAQFMVYKQFFLHGEYEVTKAEIPFEDSNTPYISKIKKTVGTPLLGAGYRTEFSSNAAADIVVLYNFNSGIANSVYGQPEIRFNFLFNIGR